MPTKVLHTSKEVIAHDRTLKSERQKEELRDKYIRDAKVCIDFVVKWGDVKYPKSFLRRYDWAQALMCIVCPCIPCVLCFWEFVHEEKRESERYMAQIMNINKDSRQEIYSYGAQKIREAIRDGRHLVARKIAQLFSVDVELRRRLAGLNDVPTPADILEAHDFGVADWEDVPIETVNWNVESEEWLRV